MLITFFDCETNGMLDDPNSLPCEVAAVLVDMNSRRVVSAFSDTLNFYPEGFQMPPETERVHAMSTDFVRRYGLKKDSRFLMKLSDAMRSSAAVCASNGLSFDYPMVSRLFAPEPMPDIPWIDDFVDFEYPPHFKGKNLGHKAADHGFLNPFSHSALGDAMTLAYIVLRGGYDMQAALESAKSPLVYVEALVSFENKDLAKAAGFHWNPSKKQWFKVMREKRHLEMAGKDYGFRTRSTALTPEKYAEFLAESRK